MGFDVTLASIDPQGGLLRELRAGNIHPETMQFVDYYYRKRKEAGAAWLEFARNGDKVIAERQVFVNCLEEMLAKKPGIHARRCDLYRDFGKLRWALERVAKTSGDKVWGRWAVEGNNLIHPDAKSSHGFGIRWCGAEEVRLVAAWLEDIDADRLASVCNIAAMKKDSPYKVFPDSNEEEITDSVRKRFVDLKAYFQSVAKNGEASLVIKD